MILIFIVKKLSLLSLIKILKIGDQVLQIAHSKIPNLLIQFKKNVPKSTIVRESKYRISRSNWELRLVKPLRHRKAYHTGNYSESSFLIGQWGLSYSVGLFKKMPPHYWPLCLMGQSTSLLKTLLFTHCLCKKFISFF